MDGAAGRFYVFDDLVEGLFERLPGLSEGGAMIERNAAPGARNLHEPSAKPDAAMLGEFGEDIDFSGRKFHRVLFGRNGGTFAGQALGCLVEKIKLLRPPLRRLALGRFLPTRRGSRAGGRLGHLFHLRF